MIKEDENKLDQLFRSRLEQYSQEPPSRVWEKVRAGITDGHRTGRLLYLRWAAAAAILLIAVVTGVLLNNNRNEISPGITGKSPVTVSQSKSSAPENNNKQLTATIISPAPASYPKQAGATGVSALSQKNGTFSKEKETTIILTREVVSISAIKRLSGLPVNPLHEPELAVINGRGSASGIIPAARDQMPVASVISKKGFTHGGRNNWEVGIRISPALSSYTSSHGAEYTRSMTSSGHQPRTDVGGGISVQYAATGRWRLESGVYYSRAGDKSGSSLGKSIANADYTSITGSGKNNYTTAVSVNDGQIAMNSTAGVIRFSKTAENAELVASSNSAINLNTAVLASGEFSQIFDLMEIPLSLRYRIIDAKIGVELFSGISTNFVIGNNAFMENASGRNYVGTTSDISTLNFSGLAGIGLKYRLGKNLFMSVEPKASYFLNSLNKSSDVDFRPWRVGISTGLNYKF